MASSHEKALGKVGGKKMLMAGTAKARELPGILKEFVNSPRLKAVNNVRRAKGELGQKD